MAQLQIHGLTKSYGARVILDNATAAFGDHQKIGVIGRNGAGKSTMCRIITGEEEADSGNVTASNDLRLRYLEQHDSFKSGETVQDFLMRKSGKQEWECAEMAARFQIHYERFVGPIESLAGGFRTRTKLAEMLLGDPNFLIMDEPTNYLDLSTLILLENFLQEFRGGYLIVSHDREFLKRTCECTLEVEEGVVKLYPGNVDEYFASKEEAVRHQVAHNQNVLKKKAELQGFVDRFKAKASMASRARSKLKQIARLKTIEIARPPANVRMRIPQMEAKKGIALVCNQLVTGYGEKIVTSNINIQIERGSHVALLGDNGQGKTTFFRTIADDLPKLEGDFQWGSGLKIAYYAQHVFQTLHPDDDVMGHLVREAVPGITQQEILNLAGSFLFRGDDTKKKVKVLSGGERARLCLAGLLLTKPHVLLLDEPTNHLDFETVEVLADALKNFSGTVLFISHDRTFVNTMASHILDMKDGFLSNYPGTYEDYVDFLERQARGESDEDDDEQSSGKSKKEHKKAAVDSEERVAEKKRQTNDLNDQISALEEDAKAHERKTTNLKKELDRLTKEAAINPFNFSKERNIKIKDFTIRVEQEEDKYLKVLEKIEKQKKALTKI